MKCPRCKTTNNVMDKKCSACGMPLSLELLTLKRLSNDRYRVDRQIGRGGMGIVLKGYDMLSHRPIAIKMLLTDAMKGENIGRFRREFQAMKKLQHPNIVSVYDFIEQDVYCFYIMEYIKGRSLGDYFEQDPVYKRLQENFQTGLQQFITYIRQLCDGLDFIHHHGFIHRDIKPGNVMIADEGTVKLMDFGLVKSRDFSISLTRTGIISGTVAYMSPEQAMGKNLDLRTDIYSLGVVLYESLTGRLPFYDENPINLLVKTIHSTPATPSSINPALTPDIDRIILKCLHKDPQMRFPHMRALKECLLSLSSERLPEKTDVLPVQHLSSASAIRHLLQPRFSGRMRERTMLMGILDKAIAGEGQVVILKGAHGIGKTRLIEELKHEALTRNLRFFHGVAYSQKDVPYKPFTDIVEQFAQYASLMGVESDPEFASIDIVPLRRIVSAASTEIDTTRTNSEQIQQSLQENRNRVFDIFDRFFRLLARDSPLIIFLDNIHQIDENSLQLFHHLARSIPTTKIMLIGALRDDHEEPSYSGARAPELIEVLSHHVVVHEVPLGCLTQTEIDTMIRSMMGIEELSPETSAYLYRSSTGNPMIAQETLKNLINDGLFTYTEQGWRETKAIETHRTGDFSSILSARLAHLPREQHRFLSLASILGTTFDVPLLLQLADINEDEGAHLLRELSQEEFIEEINIAGGDRYSFVHDDVCMYLYNGFSQQERSKLHGRVLELMKSFYKDAEENHVDRLFHHAFNAEGNSITAAYYARVAGDRYVTQYALQSARFFYQQALQILDSLRISTVTRMEFFTVHQSLARLHHYLGNVRECLHHYFHALETVKKLKDNQLIVQCLLNIAAYFRGQRELDKATVSVEKALKIAERANLSHEKAHILSLFGDIRSSQGFHDHAVELLSSALRLFRGLKDREGEYQALIYYGNALSRRADHKQALEIFQLALDNARENENSEFEWHSMKAMIDEYLCMGDVAAASANGDELVELSEKTPKTMQSQARIVAGRCSFLMGDNSASLKHYQAAMRIFEDLDDEDRYIATRIRMGRCLCRLTEYQHVMTIIEDLYRNYKSGLRPLFDLSLLCLLAQCYAETGLVHHLSAFISKIESHEALPGNEGDGFLVSRLCGDAYFALESPARAKTSYLKALRTAREQQRTIEEMTTISCLIMTYLSLAERDNAGSLFKSVMPSISRTTLPWELCRIHFAFGVDHLKLKQYDAAYKDLNKAVTIAAECNFPFFYWQASACLGHLYKQSGKESEAIPHFRDAQRVIQRIINATRAKYRKDFLQWTPVRELLHEIEQLDRTDVRRQK